MKITDDVFASGDRIELVTFLDAGISGTGYASWKLLEKGVASRPVAYGTIPKQEAEDWQESAYAMCQRLSTAARGLPILGWANSLVIERPILWAGSAKSHAAAASGKLFKQMYFIGMVCHAWMGLGIFPAILVEPKDWKGSMDKPAVEARIKRAIGLCVKSHAADAVGMGLAAAGVL